MKTYKVKRLWHNLASVRDYVIQDCIIKNQDLCLVLETTQEKMVISYQELIDRMFQAHTTVLKGKFGKDYQLIDFAWKPQSIHIKPSIKDVYQEIRDEKGRVTGYRKLHS